MVIGDHGMNEQGNHGGGTEQETNTIIFGYSKKAFPIIVYIGEEDWLLPKEVKQKKVTEQTDF